MKPIRPALNLILMFALLAVAGCAATPEDRWFQQREALNTANRIYLAHVPVLPDEEIVRYGELLQTARQQLDIAQAQLPEGGPGFDAAMDLVETLLIHIIALDNPSDTPRNGDAPDDPR